MSLLSAERGLPGRSHVGVDRHDALARRVVAKRGDLPDLPALVPGHRRRRHRRPGRHPPAAGYLAALGVDAVWISPFFPSPMADFGYDVADYCDDRPALRHAGRLRRADGRGPRRAACSVILDFVPNHTSDLHPWFVRKPRVARATRSATGISGATPPRMAARRTTGSAISAARRGRSMPATGQYYYHSFLKEQPDLNWRNPGVRARDVRRAALLARPRRRRIPRRRASVT